jgi:hypothetical protein
VWLVRAPSCHVQSPAGPPVLRLQVASPLGLLPSVGTYLSQSQSRRRSNKVVRVLVSLQVSQSPGRYLVQCFLDPTVGLPVKLPIYK